ncbi:hypothetical protein PR002_g32062, partial [Phytophthora rubi]
MLSSSKIFAMCVAAVAVSSGVQAEKEVAETFGLLGLGLLGSGLLGHGVSVGVPGVASVGVGPGAYGPGVVSPGVSVGVPGIASVGVGLPGVGVGAPAGVNVGAPATVVNNGGAYGGAPATATA